MPSNKTAIQAVPTNIITGFLGSGKTTTLLHLMGHKPHHERWAILINEFGEIGVDGSLIQGQHSESEGVFIREVPGGCLCCAAGLPIQVAINQLLQKARPDRLIIEPTGLGHPKEIVETLLTPPYDTLITLQTTLTLIDARKLSDTRYTQHESFNQQIAIADIIVGNKSELYDQTDKDALIHYVATYHKSLDDIIFTQQGNINPLILHKKSHATAQHACHGHHHHDDHNHTPPTTATDKPLPESGYLRAVHEGADFSSIGWRIAADKVFNRHKLLALLNSLRVDRLKAVLITQEGLFGYNLANQELTETELAAKDSAPSESRIEIIAHSLDTTFDNNTDQFLETQLWDCLMTN